MPNDPIKRFSLWFRAAQRRTPGRWFDPTAMTLATAGKNGEVTARMVLLKQFGSDGFTFFTNRHSRKGRQLAENPRAALVIYWPHLHRQVRIEGTIESVSAQESDEYFQSRPRLSRIAAAISPQSEVIPSRAFLLKRFKRLQETLAGKPVPLPANWGGYRLTPETIEFWQHRKNRLHDRTRFRKGKGGRWISELLAP